MASKASYRFFDLTLSRRTQVSPSLVCFTFTGPELDRMAAHAPDQRVKLFFPQSDAARTALNDVADQGLAWYDAYRALPEARRAPMRTYTIRALRSEPAEVDIEFVLHGDNGPASRWAMTARPGDRLTIIAPDASFEGESVGFEWKPPRHLRRLLIVADETALPAATGILETLNTQPSRPRVEALLEVPLSADIQPIASTAHLHWLPRDSQPGCAHGELLARAVRDIDLREVIEAMGGKHPPSSHDDAPDIDVQPLWETAELEENDAFYAWIAAESKAAVAIRRYLTDECGLPKRNVTCMGYWRLGKVVG
ncbi:siderophore-interacting protein [Billgrantia endophytica]|uniref:Siderophore-interacting protein n=1 Tax=Billgrantia endophytica TaxID=2033802 RepID=A0A2N7TXI7_9GAMM|nr:siderophore-interacting protein [Halomonas endophytica]PMR72904.1 siderophore-interacting protein [Halomonas endophytica]